MTQRDKENSLRERLLAAEETPCPGNVSSKHDWIFGTCGVFYCAHCAKVVTP